MEVSSLVAKLGFVNTTRKPRSNQRNGRHPPYENEKRRMSESQVKVMMIILFNIRGVIMIEWVPEGQLIHQGYSWRS